MIDQELAINIRFECAKADNGEHDVDTLADTIRGLLDADLEKQREADR